MNARLLTALTVLNLALLGITLARSVEASAPDVAPVLRGRALEIVDAAGRVRASIAVLPAAPDAKMPDGSTGYPETVLLRLVTAQGRPNVKIAANERGSVVLAAGASDPAYVQILAEGSATAVKLSGRDGRVHTIEP